MSLARSLSNQFSGLWRHPDFLKLWTGQTVSIFGTLVTRFAVPLIAALLLGAGPVQMALLTAAEVAPGLALGMLAGVFVDRLRRRPILIAADLARAVVLASIPLAALLGALTLAQLYVVALVVSVLGVFFDVAYPAYLPTLIRREQLVEGNSKLEASGAVAEVAGWSIAGLLVQALSAPLAIVVDAASFLFSAASVLAIRRPEPPPASPARAKRGAALREALDGLRFVALDPVRRALVGVDGVSTLFGNTLGTVIILFLARELRLSPAVMGASFAVGGISAFCGATLAQPITRRLGLGRTMLLMTAANIALSFTMPLAAGPALVVVLMITLPQLSDGTYTIRRINQLSLLQAVTPDRLQGRVHAAVRVVEAGATLGGLALGGYLGATIGLRATLFVACAGRVLGLIWLARSPVRSLRDLPVVVPEPEDLAAEPAAAPLG
jgi:predicted MFS family arabinose efflux permease